MVFSRTIGVLIIQTLLIPQCFLHAQQVPVTSGETYSSSYGSCSFSIGQTNFHQYYGNSHWLAIGIQQPYEIYRFIGVNELTDPRISISIYPNPTNDFLIINIPDYASQELNYTLYNTQGKSLESNIITKYETTLTLAELPSASYLLSINYKDTKQSKIFKIIKH